MTCNIALLCGQACSCVLTKQKLVKIKLTCNLTYIDLICVPRNIPIPSIIASLTIESLRVIKLENNQHLKSSVQQLKEWRIGRQCFLNYSLHYSDVNVTKILATEVLSSDHYSKKIIMYQITLQHICPARLKILKPSRNTVFPTKKKKKDQKKSPTPHVPDKHCPVLSKFMEALLNPG